MKTAERTIFFARDDKVGDFAGDEKPREFIGISLLPQVTTGKAHENIFQAGLTSGEM